MQNLEDVEEDTVVLLLAHQKTSSNIIKPAKHSTHGRRC
jgi:hypothetical protein